MNGAGDRTVWRTRDPQLTDPVFSRPGLLYAHIGNHIDVENTIARVPDHIKRNLELAHSEPFIRASNQGYEELINTELQDATAITAAAETIMVPDFNLPAFYMGVGRTLKYTLIFRVSTTTAAQTLTLRLRWGGVAGVVMAASGAFVPDPTAASTNVTHMVEWWVVQRTKGTTGTSMTVGRVTWNDFDDTSVATLKAGLDMMMAPPSGPAVATVDTTVIKALSPTYANSLATGSAQTHISLLESLN